MLLSVTSMHAHAVVTGADGLLLLACLYQAQSFYEVEGLCAAGPPT
jgi:hypothetical protein